MNIEEKGEDLFIYENIVVVCAVKKGHNDNIFKVA